uniref:C-type LECtin n=1 Tax=Acrobeloides nanus TaxID=290746 RepID=A0A914D317_9BILA
MKLIFGFLVLILAKSYGRTLPSLSKSLSAEPPCSSNASAAWVDVVLLIDNSINMGASNLNKAKTVINSVFSKFPLGNNDNIKQGVHNTRVGIVTYNYEASIVAQFTDINNKNDLSRVLDDDCPNGFRPVAFVIFAASSYPSINNEIPALVSQSELFDFDVLTLITVNLNNADHTLTSILNKITYNSIIQTSMYNFSIDSNTISDDLEWALLQANCFCMYNTGITSILYDPSKNRYARYGECATFVSYQGFAYDNIIDMCKYVPGSRVSFESPGYILSKEKEFLVKNLALTDPSILPFYIGYHKNSSSNWVWYDVDLSESAGSGYSNWAPGYPQNNNMMNCTVINSSDSVTFNWKNVPCDPQYSKVSNILCQNYVCDAEHTECIKYYMGLT